LLAVLEFSPFVTPSPAEIKKRWKDLCKKHHPDVGGSEEKFKEVTHAYKMLTDAEYATKHKPMERKHLDLRIQFAISFDEAFAGTKLVMNFSVTEFDDKFEAIRKETIETESLTVEVCAGSFDQEVLRIPGKGLRKGDQRGDVYLHPQLVAHPKFKAAPKGFGMWDIIGEERIPLHMMLVGGRMEILTMKGIKNLKIPPGTAPGAFLRIDGAGCKGGDHVVVVSPIYPNEKELKGAKWTGLGIKWGMEEPLDMEEEGFLRLNDKLRNAYVGDDND
jgi:DnaJ-class molecular chaperone